MPKHLSTLAILSLLISNLFVSAAAAETQTLDYIVAIVNDDVIVNTALQQELRLVLEKWQEKPERLPPRQHLEKQVLERMIMTTLQLQMAKRMGMKVEDSQLNETLRRLAAQEKMDLSDYRAQIENKGYSYKYWREELRHEIIINRLKQRLVVSRATITDREVDNFLANQVKQGTVGKEYHIWHILIAMPEAPTAEDIATKQQKAKDVLAKLKQGADFKTTAVAVSEGRQAIQGGDLGWLKAGNIPTLFESIVNNITVGEIKGPLRDASGFHIIKLVDKRGGESIITQTNVRHILIKTNDLVSDFDAQNHLEELKSRIEQGDDFIELARANSEDAGSAANGGSLGWINPNDFVPEFEDVMNSLSENQVSKAFKSRFGWHIVQVLGRRQHENTEQAWRTQATQQIRQRKIEDLEQAWRRQLREEGYIEYRNGDFANDAESTGFR